MTIYNQYIILNNAVNELYSGIASDVGNIFEIQVTENIKKQYKINLEYRSQWKDWVPI